MKKLLDQFEFESNAIFQGLSQEDNKAVKNAMEPINFKKGAMLFYEEGVSTGIFLLIKGKAKIYKTGVDNKEQIFYIYREDDLIGYHALLCNERYADSCEAIENCETMFISAENFLQLTEQIPSLKQSLIKNMSHEFGVLVNTITVLAQKSLRVRFALYLLILDNKYNTSNAPNNGINLSREDLANIIGTARESLGKLLKEFREEGLISVTKRIIFVENHQKLLDLVNSSYC
jgi:CRP-like cAMP-binding protein